MGESSLRGNSLREIPPLPATRSGRDDSRGCLVLTSPADLDRAQVRSYEAVRCHGVYRECVQVLNGITPGTLKKNQRADP